MEKTDTRSRSYCVILYPDDVTHIKALDYVKQAYESYAYIVHDKDLNEAGDTKKSHIHLVVEFKNARYLTAVSTELGLESNYMQKCRNVENALEYLLHLKNDDKYSYNLDEVKATTDMYNRLKRKLSNLGKDETDKAINLFKFIDEYPVYLYHGTFQDFATAQGQFDVMRRAYSIFSQRIYEHNIRFCTKHETGTLDRGVTSDNQYNTFLS